MTDYVKNLTAYKAPHPFFTEAERLARELREETTCEGGVLRWQSNGAVPFADAIALAAHVGVPGLDVAKSNAARQADTEAFFAEYRRNPPTLTEEDLFEARAAHGPGVVLEDIITGRKFTT